MDVEKLTVELRPRPHAQAIDLGFALLRSRATTVYASWWVVWVGIVGLASLGTWIRPSWFGFWVTIPWALRPAMERMVVHILSRSVFGEDITWKAALRAWPSTWAGGLIRALTWWRFWALGRSFLQPSWQLEGVRGEFADRRREALSRKGTGHAAAVWGGVCAHLEWALWAAFLALAGLFSTAGSQGNPFRFVLDALGGKTDRLHAVVGTLSYGVALGLIGPCYAACGFTLYLNRRAELEAWDIELALRKLLHRQAAAPARTRHISSIAGLLLVLVGATQAQNNCEAPLGWIDPATTRAPSLDARRQALRTGLDSIYRHDALLRTWNCEPSWVAKPSNASHPTTPPAAARALAATAGFVDQTAGAIRWILVAGALAVLGWLAWKYRLQEIAPSPKRPGRARLTKATGHSPGTDFPDQLESLLQLWNRGQRREALSGLYLHACSWITTRGAVLRPSATERQVRDQVRALHRQNQIETAELELLATTIRAWSRAAWADHWPDDQAMTEICQRWRRLGQAGLWK